MFLCLCLIVGSVTPIFEFSRGVLGVLYQKTIFASADEMKSLEDGTRYDSAGRLTNGNFLAEFPKEKIFFKYLARK